MDIQFLKRNQVPTPGPGQWYLFYDLDNGSVLTAKDSNCDFYPLGELPSLDTSKIDDCICDALKQIIDDAGCAMKKGIINATEYESITDDINIYSIVTIDPSTGGYSHGITSTATLFVALTTTNVLCNGDSNGTAAASVTGGVAPYTITYTDLAGASVNPAALAAGAYKVTVVDAGGTTKVTTFVITEPAALGLTVNVQNESAPAAGDGAASAVVTGGTTPYTYEWRDNLGTPIGQTTQTATGLTAGTYQVVVTDANGCTIQDTNVVIA